MGKHNLTRHIATGIDVRQVGFAEIVDDYRSAIEFNIVQRLEAVEVGTTTDRNQNPLCGYW